MGGNGYMKRLEVPKRLGWRGERERIVDCSDVFILHLGINIPSSP